MRLILSALIFMSFLGTVTAQTKDETTVARAVETLRIAMLNADKAGLEKIASPKLTYGHSSGKIQNQKEFINSLVTGESDFVTLDFTEQAISITGQTAIVRHTLSGKTNDGGKAGTVKLLIMLVWAKEGGQWKLIGRQAVKPMS